MDKWIERLDRLYPQLRNRWTRCHFCGRPTQQIHHIRGRRNLLLRYDINNLIPLCADCHSLVHLKNLDLYIPVWRMEYLNKMGRVQFQDYLLKNGLTREEFFKQQEITLKEYIHGIGEDKRIFR